jgi:hypothetical protein
MVPHCTVQVCRARARPSNYGSREQKATEPQFIVAPRIEIVLLAAGVIFKSVRPSIGPIHSSVIRQETYLVLKQQVCWRGDGQRI